MHLKRIVSSLLLISLTASLSGCATLLSDRKYDVTMDNSGGATYFSVYDYKNRVVESGVTPQQVTLKSKAAPFRPGKYHVVFAGQGGVDQQTLKGKLDWWTAGNIIIGGVPGFIVDAATGALWKLDSRVTGQVSTQNLVSNTTQGAAVLAAYSSGPPPASGIAAAASSSDIKQASFRKSETAP